MNLSDNDRLLKNVNKIPELIANGKLTKHNIPNPHWRDGTCHACHTGDPEKTPVTFRGGSPLQPCQYCHDRKSDHSLIHPVDIKPDAVMISRMPASYQRTLADMDNKITCLTCHDAYKQCLPKFRLQKGLNSAFFRKGPFRYRSEQCYFCHDAEQYKRFNPHKQKTEAGLLREDTCRICHSDDMEVLQSNREDKKLQFYGNENLSSLCTRCHQVKPHPVIMFSIGPGKKIPNHLVKPSDKIHKLLLKRTKVDDIVFPLEPESGKVFCATCHNPHDKGVLKHTSLDAGTDNKNRLRTRGKKICLYCHDI